MRVFVPCIVDKYVDLSKNLEDFGRDGGRIREDDGLETGRWIRRDGAVCSIDLCYAFISEQIPPLVPAKSSACRTRDKGMNAPMIRTSQVGLASESQARVLKRSAPKPNEGETEAGYLRVIQSLRFLARLCNLHVGEPRSTPWASAR